MTPFRPFLTSWLRVAATVSCGLLSSGSAFAAEPLAVPFLPPDVDLGRICVPRPPIHEVIQRWSEWDRQSLGDQSTEQVRRDLRLLRENDAAGWFDTIETAQNLLRQADPDYTERDQVIDRIDLAIAAGRPELLEQEGLVDRLFALGIDTSPGAQYFAARLLRDGTGVARDEARAEQLLVSAAYGGHSDALLEMAGLTSDGTKVDGWDIEPELAVTLAFGGLIGNVDEMICDRINRIASSYRLGEVVAQDTPLALDWYRLAAELGDFNSAWQVAQINLRAEGIEKNNEELLAHLEQAAEGGLPFAQVELGRIYEVGALAEKDVERARSLYRQAASIGNYEGLVRLASFIKALENPTPEDLEERQQALRDLAAQPTPPAFALIEMGDLAIEAKGRWAGESEAADYFRRAHEADPADPTATSRVAQIGFRHAKTEQEFLDLTAELQEAVLASGSANGMDQLVSAFTCRSPAAPDRERSAYWRQVREDTDSVLAQPDATTASAEGGAIDAMTLARLQSQALAGRSSSLAALLELQEAYGLDLDPALLEDMARSSETGPLTEMARLELRNASSPQARAAALDKLREAIDAGEARASTELLNALIGDGISEDEAVEVSAMAEPMAAEGRGLGMRALAMLDGDDAAANERIFTEHRDVIEADGDFDALVFALPFLADDAARNDYLGRIRASMPCNTGSALNVAKAMDALGRQDEADRWLDIAGVAAGANGSQIVAVADAMREVSDGPEALDASVSLLKEESEKGNRIALLRLVALADGDQPRFTPPKEELASLFVDLIGVSDVSDVPNVLRRVRRADPEVRSMVESQVDVRALYVQAAEAGDPVGQLELAKIVQAEAQGQSDLAEYARLLTASAEQGEPEAMYLLSTAYSFGLGVEPSLDTSRDWLFRAAEAGNKEALDTVRLLETQGISQ
ncbi:hypothetical protein FHG66_07755 [Rubellimicrobium rubrum]|uniref:Sel1 repeat family protein n=1 Tax=Rubellimicrobium rubrum TaxID=2585369 RepID=A0A5C4MXH3_9RHOB|nr:SEL1-like repeat protein [Rubellimicrobium rubrum]TNC50855.1 hypothetical protein FHG66_07755 [Rubellimicrobium rubrum]